MLKGISLVINILVFEGNWYIYVGFEYKENMLKVGLLGRLFVFGLL